METLDRLEEQKSELLTLVRGWPEARLQFHPAPGQWSALQVFDHIERTERVILDAAKAGVVRPHSLGARDRLGYLFLEKVFQTERKVKVPSSAKIVLPGAEPGMDNVLARWQETRNDLRVFYDALTPEQLRRGIFRHPVAGWMDMTRILGFFSVHITHHVFQIQRLCTASGSTRQ